MEITPTISAGHTVMVGILLVTLTAKVMVEQAIMGIRLQATTFMVEQAIMGTRLQATTFMTLPIQALVMVAATTTTILTVPVMDLALVMVEQHALTVTVPMTLTKLNPATEADCLHTLARFHSLAQLTLTHLITPHPMAATTMIEALTTGLGAAPD